MPAKTIDEVIDRLNQLVDRSLREDLPIGYFAALYLRVTEAVRRAILAGDVFQDNERMDQLDVLFANRFLDAWDAHTAGQKPTAPWALTFRALQRKDLAVFQHLALGMNAHIDFDLGLSAEEVCRQRGQPIASLREDFLTINTVLARLTPVMQVKLGQLSTTFSRLELLAPKLQTRLAGVLMGGARDAAWMFTERLGRQKGPKLRGKVMAERELVTVAAGEALLDPLLGEELLERIAREEAERSVRARIQIIAG